MLTRIKKDIALKKAKGELEKLLTKKREMEEQASQIREDLEKTEDLTIIEELQKTLEEIITVEPQELIQGIEVLKSTVEQLEDEIQNLDKKNEELTKDGNNIKDTGERGRTMNIEYRSNFVDTQNRQLYYEDTAVREFYEKIRSGGITGSSNLIPMSVVNKINSKVYLKSKFYRYVNVIKVRGETKIVFSNDKLKANWIKAGQSILNEVAGTINAITLDSFKLAKLTNVPNELLDDSIINLDEFITDKFSTAIAITLDEAIIKGTGVDEPTGIITALLNLNKINIDNTIEDILQTISNIEVNDGSEGNLKLIVNRKTFYNRLIKHTINSNSAGELVAQSVKVNKPMLLDMEIVLSSTMADNQLLIGELEEYTLGDRQNTVIAKSTDAGFDTDSTYFRATARYDGKLTNDKSFVLLTLNDAPIVKKKA